MRIIKKIFILFILAGIGFVGYKFFLQYMYENAILKQVIARLEADSRVAEVLVTNVNYDEKNSAAYTTIKFLEYDTRGNPLPAKYFTFSGNIIQFQSLVIRFDDIHVRSADRFKGKSAYIFWKAFVLDGQKTQEFEITKINQIPQGYKLSNESNPFEQRLWQEFWRYALDPQKAHSRGIKNAQIEAPGAMFVPGYLYTIKIEHDGGLRIDASPISPVLRGENIP